MDNLKKFETQAQYEAATLSYPNVSWIVSGDTVHYVKEKSTFSGLTVYYDINDTSYPIPLFNGGSGSGSGSGSGGGVLPSAMKIDGTEVEVTNSYQFSTTGEHIVQFSFEENTIPHEYFSGFPHLTKVEIGDAITSIDFASFMSCTSLSSVTIGNSVTSIGGGAFSNCNLSSVTIPNSVTSIGGDGVFSNRNLSSITSLATTAPTIQDWTFFGIKENGTLYVPIGSSGYDTWMQNADYYLGYFNWTKVEQ